ncbi:MAG: trypsin-like peptidase domain-containing protein [Bacteroidales bacterium]|nr:trypsin-like peptidase domain-containing protein [Bacteroidales bacterium]
MKKIAGSLLIAIAGGLIALGAYSLISKKEVKYINSASQSTPAYLTGLPGASGTMVLPDFTVAANNTIHAVVHIRTEYERKSSVYDYFFDFRDFFGQRGPQGVPGPIEASGSGVIISPDGYIVTNNHVVTESNKIQVTLNDKRTYDAQIIGTDPSTDLAVIKIDAKDLPFLVYGNSDNVQIGEWVLTVSNPFNLTSTVTAGIVSAKARNINILGSPDGSAIESFIQTDAAVNPGNSGGALVNTNGELVGINAAIASGTGYYAGYSFAIPANIVRKVAGDLMEYGTIQRGFLGVSIRELDSKLAEEEGIDDIHGVFVADVTENGAAQDAGIKSGDIIMNIEGVPVNSTSELLGLIGQHRPGDKINLAVKRGNKEMNYAVILKNRDGNVSLVKREDVNIQSLLGANFSPVPEKLKSDLNIENGIQVNTLGDGKLRNAGVRQGFIITRVDGKSVRSIDELSNAIASKKGGILIEGIYPNRTRAYYGFGM